ncbi:hypothetical protein QN372_19545 [Undibacterium sp. RTI2.1]|uniref:hypothetical protein n=1 Tax=unclassified Undibacterium TaxID=2630295 RepID=UPI002AB48DC8|nr:MULTISPECIES: hypothetical protein [unclassified Undibacterium]MDY7540544.1 hypothetical protein [Undibacterium sp. 5I1]MEB0032946.1 hypothetical protein [Undibacterium sp. RTI2.1]MEB0116514.1 hypothetical protein [Undibacterium sp. RTI2.2]MEB0231206.1 hypothetical protein [Undibacterium sp. 10I3]MEB0256509.1 hypothetical protein [Undibacterium sp. 5I1]
MRGASGAFVIDAYNCKANNIPNCAASLTLDKEVSSISVMSWNKKNSPTRPDNLPNSYTNVNLGGGSASTIALGNAAAAFKFKSEACYPLDKLANKYKTNESLVKKLAELENLYASNKAKGETEACESCILQGIEESFGISLTSEGLRSAMQKKTFDEFVYKVLFGDATCNDLNIIPKPYVGRFPNSSEEQSRIKKIDLVGKAKEILAKDIPVLLNEICTVVLPDGSCLKESYHTVVLTGFKEVCKDGEKKVCRNIVRVQNSWCGDWDKEFGDEAWVDAETLMNSVGSFPVHRGVLGWLETHN